MARLFVLVEGQTEETFVNEVLAPQFYPCGYTQVSARLVGNARQRDRRGGIRGWDSVRKDILKHLKEDRGCVVTTMVDYYALPQTGKRAWPRRDESGRLPFAQKAQTIETAMLDDICSELSEGFDPRRFVPYVVMHEFEGLLFSDAARLARGIGRPDLTPQFQAICDQFATPEEINDSAETAPSKRVARLVPGYEKPFLGTLAALEIGLDTMRRACPLFHNWLTRLEQWPALRIQT